MPSKSRKFTQNEVEAWSLEGVKEWLVSVKLESCTDEFLEQNVDGCGLLQLTTDDIKDMVQGDKQRKAMKKALSSLPGNSVSKKESKAAKKKKQDRKSANVKKTRGPLPAEPKPPPLPLDHPSSPGLPPGPPPPVPTGSSRPTFQRLGPPIPITPRPVMEDDGQDLYDEFDVGGMDGGPDDVYDSVDPDEIAEISNSLPPHQSPHFVPPSPTFAPPPPMAPPGAEGYDEEDDQPIYDDGLDEEGDDSFDDEDSFESSDPDEDYEEPFEENPGLAAAGDSRNRLASNANIRSVMGKFYAHGVLKEEAGKVFSGASSGPGESFAVPPPPGPPPDDQGDIIEEDIYDTVPDEVKDMIAEQGLEEPIEEDIYDIPPEQEELQAAFNRPVMKAPISNSPKAPPPPPEAPPPPDEIEEDVYDVPSEVIEENQLQESVPNIQVYKPPAPPLPPSDELEPAPMRPPKLMGSPALPSKQTFNRPPMRGPIGAKPPPTEELPPSRPPKPEPVKAPPPPPLHDEEPSVANGFFNKPKLRSPMMKNQGGGAPPPRPPNSSKPPPSPSMEQKTPGDSITEKLARLTPVGGRTTPQSPSPHQSPIPSPGLLRKSASPDLPPTTAPPPPPGPPMKHPAGKKFGNPPKPGMKHTNSDDQSEEPPPSEPARVVSPAHKVANVMKPPLTNKSTRLADRMKMFEGSDSKNKPPPPGNKPALFGNKPSLKSPPPKPSLNTSPMSGRKMQRDSNINDLMSKFGGRKSASPVNDRSSSSPERPPFMPPKPAGSGAADSSPKSPPWKKDSPSEAPLPPRLPSKPPVESTHPSMPRSPAKQWPPPQEPDNRTNLQISKKKFELPPKAEELPPKRESPSLKRKVEPPPRDDLPPRRDSPSFRKKLPSNDSDEQERKPFSPPNFRLQGRGSEDSSSIPSLPPRIPDSSPPLHRPEPTPSLPPRNSPALPARNQEPHSSRVPDPTPSLPPRPADPTPSLPPRAPDPTPSLPPRVSDPTPSLPPRLLDTTPSLPPKGPEPMESNPPHLPERSWSNQSAVPGPLLGGPPKLPNRPPPTGAPRLPDRNPPSHRPPFSPPGDSELRLPPRPGQQAMPPLPSRPPPKEPPQTKESIPNRPPKPSGSPVGLSWYHGNLDRKRAEVKLKKYAKDGTFIIRDSSKIQGEYSLSLWHSGGIRHLRIRLREDKKFVLGEEKSDELPFETVIALVEYHKKEPLHLRSGGDTVLKYECSH